MLHNSYKLVGDNAHLYIKDWSLSSYLDLLTIRAFPQYEVQDRTLIFPARYIGEKMDYQHLPLPITGWLFDYQKMLVKVAWLKRRYAYFLDPGLGKTAPMAELARQLHASTPHGKIIFCTELNPLKQLWDMCHELNDFPESIYLYDNKSMTFHEWLHYDNVPRIGFVNHEVFIKYDKNFSDKVIGFFLDESSILKGGAGGNGKIAKNIIKATKGVDIKIASSGTPSPNDQTEYAMHALFLELVTSENEFLQQYFLKKNNKWVMRIHAHEAFYKDLSTSSFFMRNPVSYGFNDNLKNLTPIEEIRVRVEVTPEQIDVIHNRFRGKSNLLPGLAVRPTTMTQRTKFAQVSKGFYYSGKNRDVMRVKSNKPQVILDLINQHENENILIRVVYDEEGNILEEALIKANIQHVHITAKTKIADRLQAIDDFANGKLRILMGKAEVLGKGLNLQKYCHIFIVSGQSDSFEDDYQFKKRLHRIGQNKKVLLYRVYTDYELVTLDNVLRKSKQMEKDFEMQEFLYRQSIFDELQEYLTKGDFSYMTTEQMKLNPIITDQYQIYHTNSLAIMLAILDKNKLLSDDETEIVERWQPPNNDTWLDLNSVDFSIFSEPFMSDRFTYSNDIGDMGNTKGAGAVGGLHEFMLMRRFFLKGLLAVTKPGRLAAMHVEQVPLIKGVDGQIGYFDYRGWAIETSRQMGWIPVGDIPIIKNQQAQAAVKHVASLAMGNMWKDRNRIAPCLNGYLLVFKKPGDNDAPIANLFRCECGWEGVYDECAITVFAPERSTTNGYQPDARKNFDAIGRNRPGCPVCGNTNLQADMNFDRWVRDAMGAWFENEQDEMEAQYSRLSNNEVSTELSKEYARKLHATLGRFLDGEMDNEFKTLLSLWYDIRETDILPGLSSQDKEALQEDKHLCPLPRTIAQRAIRLWSNEGDTVLSPFMGSGTEGVEALNLRRKFIGLELKPEYFLMAHKNLEKAVLANMQLSFL